MGLTERCYTRQPASRASGPANWRPCVRKISTSTVNRPRCDCLANTPRTGSLRCSPCLSAWRPNCKPSSPDGQPMPVWPGTWQERGADMLRIDLDVVGIPYVVEGGDGPLHADFHCLRHSFVAMLDRSGETLKEAMQLSRHSDPKLTAAVYGRVDCTTWPAPWTGCRPFPPSPPPARKSRPCRPREPKVPCRACTALAAPMGRQGTSRDRLGQPFRSVPTWQLKRKALARNRLGRIWTMGDGTGKVPPVGLEPTTR